MPMVSVGNPDPIGDGAVPDSITEFTVPWSKSLADAVRDISHDDGGPHAGIWAAVSRAKAPSWVESDSAELAQALAARWGCPIGRPTS